MSFVIKERVKETSTTTGAGVLTLAGAASGFQAFSVIGDGNTTHYVLLDANGTGWEVGLGTYTLSGTTLARTTIFASSNSGSAITLSAGTHTVFCGFPAATASRLMAATNLVTGTDAATTCVANATYVVDMSGWATADRIYTCPASPSVGDRVRIVVQAGNASFELIVKGNTSQTINGGSAASEWSRLFITGEQLELLYVASNAWTVIDDGRIPMKGSMHLSTSTTATETAATYTYPTAVSGVWTADKNVGSVCATATDKIISRRACSAYVETQAYSLNLVTSGTVWATVLELNGGAAVYPAFARAVPGANLSPCIGGSRLFTFALDDYIRFQYYSSAGSIGLYGGTDHLTHLSFLEAPL